MNELFKKSACLAAIFCLVMTGCSSEVATNESEASQTEEVVKTPEQIESEKWDKYCEERDKRIDENEKKAEENADADRMKALNKLTTDSEAKFGPIYDSYGHFFVFGPKIQKIQGSKYLVGTVVNVAEEDENYVEITANLLDKNGTVIDSVMTNVNNIKSAGSWKFKLCSLSDESWSKFEITGVKNHPY